MHIISGDLWAGAEVQAYTLLKFMRQECDLHVILMNHGELEERLSKLNIPVTVLDESRLKTWRILIAMRKSIVNFQPDIVHTHRQKENVLGGLANFISTRSKSVRTSHGSPESAPKGLQKIQVFMDRLVGRYFQQAIIVVSGDLAQKLEKTFPSKKIHVIHNGVDTALLKATKSVADFKLLHPDAIHIGIVGRLEPVKRIDIFLDMAGIVLQKEIFPEIQFHVIGDGKLRHKLQERSCTLGINKVTRFHGHRADVPVCIKSMDAIVMSSDHEGTPMTALEALAVGTPVIAHNVGGLREILENYPEWLVDSQNPQEYAERLIRSLTSGAKRACLARHYEASECAKKTAALYEKLAF